MTKFSSGLSHQGPSRYNLATMLVDSLNKPRSPSRIIYDGSLLIYDANKVMPDAGSARHYLITPTGLSTVQVEHFGGGLPEEVLQRFLFKPHLVKLLKHRLER